MSNKEEQPKMLTAKNSGSVNFSGGLILFIKGKTMKKTAIRIFMALILALVMVTGLSSATEAASKGRFMRIDLVDAHWDLSGGMTWVLPSASFSYNHIRVYGYEYQWFTKSSEYDAPWEPWGDIETVLFGNLQSSGTNINLPLPLPDTWPYPWGGNSMVVVYLLDEDGNYIRGFGPPEPEPSVGWNTGYGSFYFSGYSATGYTYQWTHDGVAVGDAVVVLFGEVLTSKTSCAVPKIGNDPGEWRVDVWLLGENGHKIQKAHLAYGYQPF